MLVYIKYFFISCTQNNYTVKADLLSGSFRKANLRPGSPLGGKRNKTGERSEPRGVVYGGEKVAPPFPLHMSAAGLASLADIFPIWPRFLPFSPTAEPGPKLRKASFYNSYE